MNIEVFEQETLDGIVEKIQASTTIKYLSRVAYDKDFDIPDIIKAHLKSVAGHVAIPDLHPIKSILVSTGINLNDDFFGCEPTFAAKDTPVDKPFNYNHIGTDIIGHMTGAYVIDEAGKVIANDSPLPNKFHIINSAVLYKFWDEEDKQKRMDEIVAETSNAEANEWYVSMECRFTAFDYVLIPYENNALATSKAKIVERNTQTSHLSKHLRAYGGTGKYNGYKIGRALKNITFSGVGLVRNPANPESIILNSPEIGIAVEKFNNIPSELVYESSEQESIKEENTEMSKKTETTVAEEQKTNDTLVVKTYTEAEYNELKEKLEKSEASAKEYEATKTKWYEAATTEKAKAEELSKKLEETEKKVVALQTEVDSAKKEKRVAKVKEAYGFDTDEDAVASAELLNALDDANFEKQLEIVKKLKAKKTEVSTETKTETKVDTTAALNNTQKVEDTVPVVTETDNYENALAAELEAWVETKETNSGKKEE